MELQNPYPACSRVPLQIITVRLFFQHLKILTPLLDHHAHNSVWKSLKSAVFLQNHQRHSSAPFSSCSSQVPLQWQEHRKSLFPLQRTRTEAPPHRKRHDGYHDFITISPYVIQCALASGASILQMIFKVFERHCGIVDLHPQSEGVFPYILGLHLPFPAQLSAFEQRFKFIAWHWFWQKIILTKSHPFSGAPSRLCLNAFRHNA